MYRFLIANQVIYLKLLNVYGNPVVFMMAVELASFVDGL